MWKDVEPFLAIEFITDLWQLLSLGEFKGAPITNSLFKKTNAKKFPDLIDRSESMPAMISDNKANNSILRVHQTLD